MNLQRFRILLHKEVRYIERDWRTLFMLFGLPFVFLPLIVMFGGLMGTVGKKAEEEIEKKERRETVRVATHRVPENSLLFKALRKQKQIDLVPSQAPREDWDQGKCDVVIEAPPKASEVLRQKGSIRLHVYYNTEVTVPLTALKDALNEYAQDEMRARLGDFTLSTAYLKPVQIDYDGTSSKTGFKARMEKARKQMIPLMGLIVMLLVCTSCLSNYLFFLVEREEGTLETILSNPVHPGEVLLAKWCSLLVFTVLQMALYGIMIASTVQLYGLSPFARFFPIAFTSNQIFLLVACLLQEAMFFYALLLVVCALVQSAREANSVTGILSLFLMGLMVVPLLPIPTPDVLAVLPLGNLSFAMREVLVGTSYVKNWYAAIFSNGLYTAGLLWVACRLLGREEALLGGISVLRLILRRSDLVPRPKPSVAETFFLLLIILALFFYVATPLQLHHLVTGHLVTQVGILLLLPLALAFYLKLDWRETFQLRTPSLRVVATTVLLWAGWLLVAPFLVWIQNRILPMPSELADLMRKLLTGFGANHSLVALLTMGALLPGICEEMTFRGFVLSGFAGRWRARWAILATALAFALIHCDPWRFVPTFILGVLMGILTVRSRSIWPAMLFHTLNNGSMLWIGTRFRDATHFFQPQFLAVFALVGGLVLAVSLALLFEIRRTSRPARGASV